MADYTAKTDWKVDDEVDHDHMNALEVALSGVLGSAASTAQEVSDLRESIATQAALTTALTTRVSDLEAANTALVSRLEALETPAE